MAKANWVIVNPSSGSGNASVGVSSASEHTGRELRTTTLTWKAAGCSDVVRTVRQAGKPEFVTVDSAKSIGKEGGTLTLSGKTNSKMLTYGIGQDDIDVTIPPTYTAASTSVNNGADIPGDPGAAAEINYSIKLTIPANTTIESRTCQFIVSDDAGHDAICTITQPAGDAYLRVSPEVIELTYLGTAVSATVESNTNWTVE